ncbi:hypothetical protein [Acidisphaera sp. L21]|uniref:hypothetical protein n=1 Tax=Acidisphaera sp. L21 TaxID=1641851 RepID=UPI00131D2D93|nr:hypothetical protein [Acidisphaera sp. L21]
MKYVAPLDMLKDRLDISTVDGQVRVSLSYDGFLNLIQLIISDDRLPESPYIQRPTNEVAPVAAGQGTGRGGYFAGRSSTQNEDENWYIQRVAGGGEGGIPGGRRDAGIRERVANIQQVAETWQQQLSVVKTLMEVLRTATPPEEPAAANGEQPYDPYEVQSLS